MKEVSKGVVLQVARKEGTGHHRASRKLRERKNPVCEGAAKGRTVRESSAGKDNCGVRKIRRKAAKGFAKADMEHNIVDRGTEVLTTAQMSC